VPEQEPVSRPQRRAPVPEQEPVSRPQRRAPVPKPEPASQPPQAEPAPPSRRFAPSEPVADQVERCRIRLWRGYVSRCYIAQAEGADAPIARSPSFRAVSTPEATAALDALVAELRTQGWEPVHDAGGAWRGWMRRPTGMPARN
jgi:hypothetical protein